MKRRTVFLAGVSLLAMTAHAHALTALGSGIISGLLSLGLGGLLPAASAAAIGAGALALAGTAINLATKFIGRGGQQSNVDPTELRNTSKGQEGPGQYAFGRVELAGTVAFGNTAGYFLSRLLLHCFGPLNTVEEYFYDGRSIVVESSGNVSSPPWVTDSGGYLNIQTKVGDGTETAWASLLSDYPGLWTSNHRVRGIAQTRIRAQNPGTGNELFPLLFQGGLKELRIRAQVGKFYDPRDASTEWSMNGVLHCLHWLRTLPFVSDSILDLTDIGTVATQAEASVATLTGTAPRCQLSGGWRGPMTQEIMNDLLVSAGLDIRTTATGKYTFEFISDNPDSEITLYNRHIIDRDIRAGPEGAQRPNICRLWYFSPERRYSLSEINLDAAPWARIADEITAYGDQEMEIRLPFCCDASQAQRIARQLFHMARADFGTIRTTWAGMACWGLRTATIELPDVGTDGASVFVKCRLGTVRPNDEDGTCDIPVQIIPDILTTAWNPATDEVAPPPVLESTVYPSSLTTPDTPSAAYLVMYPGGAYEIRLVYTLPGGGTTTEAVLRVYSGGTPGAPQSMNEQVSPTTFAFYTGGTPGMEVDFRVRIFNGDGEASHFSDPLYVASLQPNNTAPAAPTATVAAIPDGDNWDQISVSNITTAAWNAAYVEIKRRIDTGGGYGSFAGVHSENIRPGSTVSHTFDLVPNLEPGDKINVQVIVHTSDGTAGTPFDQELTVPTP